MQTTNQQQTKMRSIIDILLVTVILLLCIHIIIRTKNNEEQQPASIPTKIILVIAGLAVLAVAALFLALQVEEIKIKGDTGQVGDFIGGLLNPIFSFLALLVLLRTTRIQVHELQKTNQVLEHQKSVSERQKFENTFFNLVDRFEETCKAFTRVEVDEEGNTRSDLIVKRLLRIKVKCNNLNTDRSKAKKAKTEIKIVFREIRHENLYFLRKAFRVIRFVDQSELAENDKKFYLNVFKDSLSKNEAIILVLFSYAVNTELRNLAKRHYVAANVLKGSFPCEQVFYYFNPEKASSWKLSKQI